MFRSTLKAIQAIQPHSWPPKWDLYAQAACQQSTFFHIYRCWNCCQSGLGLCCRSYTELCQGNSIKLKAFIAFNSELQAQISTHSSLAPGLGSGTTRTTGSFLFTKKKKASLQKPSSSALFSFSHCSCRAACLTTPQHHPPASAAGQRSAAMTAQKPLIKSQLRTRSVRIKQATICSKKYSCLSCQLFPSRTPLLKSYFFIVFWLCKVILSLDSSLISVLIIEFSTLTPKYSH